MTGGGGGEELAVQVLGWSSGLLGATIRHVRLIRSQSSRLVKNWFLLEIWFRGPARCLVLGWPLSISTGSLSDNLGQQRYHKTIMGRSWRNN